MSSVYFYFVCLYFYVKIIKINIVNKLYFKGNENAKRIKDKRKIA